MFDTAKNYWNKEFNCCNNRDMVIDDEIVYENQNFKSNNNNLNKANSNISEVFKNLTISKKVYWTKSEEKLLIELCKSELKKKWTKIADIIGNKTASQCNYKYKKLKEVGLFDNDNINNENVLKNINSDILENKKVLEYFSIKYNLNKEKYTQDNFNYIGKLKRKKNAIINCDNDKITKNINNNISKSVNKSINFLIKEEEIPKKIVFKLHRYNNNNYHNLRKVDPNIKKYKTKTLKKQINKLFSNVTEESINNSKIHIIEKGISDSNKNSDNLNNLFRKDSHDEFKQIDNRTNTLTLSSKKDSDNLFFRVYNDTFGSPDKNEKFGIIEEDNFINNINNSRNKYNNNNYRALISTNINTQNDLLLNDEGSNSNNILNFDNINIKSNNYESNKIDLEYIKNYKILQNLNNILYNCNNNKIKYITTLYQKVIITRIINNIIKINNKF